MQNAKFLLALGAFAVASLSLQLQAGPDTPEQAKMREALRRTMEQSTAPAPAAATPVAPPPTQSAYESTPPPADPAKAERQREAMRQKMAESQAAPTTPAPVPTTPVAPPPVQAAYKPIEAPASSLPTSKQARLSDLLVRYKADTITALEYHTQRAAIIAEP